MKIEINNKEYNIITEGLMKLQQKVYAALSTTYADDDEKRLKGQLQEIGNLRDKLRQIKENER